MKYLVWIIAVSLAAHLAVASGPQRVVVDTKNPQAARVFQPAGYGTEAQSPGPGNGGSISFDAFDRGMQVPWESNVTVYSASGQDSFLVSSSRRGCPGTEVKPSVAVAFSTARGWSDPPIRFGPLSWKTTCPLGKGMELEVCTSGTSPPFVRLVEKNNTLGRH